MSDQGESTNNNRVYGVRKSEFVGNNTTPIDDSATFDFVYQGRNIKISFANLLAQLGTTGELIQVGDPTDPAVLDDQGAQKGIRSIKGGRGIDASIDASESIKIDAEYNFDETGQALVSDPLADIPQFRSLVNGNGISLSVVDDTIVITNSDAATTTNIVMVSAIADFPVASMGVIPLADNTVYFVTSHDLDIAPYRLAMGANTTLMGASAQSSKIYTTSTSPLITATDVDFAVENIALQNQNGLIIEQESTASKTHFVTLKGLQIDNCTGFLKSTNIENLLMRDIKISESASANIFEFSGAIDNINLDTLFIENWLGTLFNLTTSVSKSINIQNAIVYSDNAANKIFDGAVDSGNIEVNGSGSVLNSQIFGTFTATNIVQNPSLRWDLDFSNALDKTLRGCNLVLGKNSTETVISAIGSAVQCQAFWSENYTSRFTSTTAGRITSNSPKNIFANVDVCFNIKKVGGGFHHNYRVYLAKNGSPLLDIYANVDADSDGKSGAITAIIELVENDYLELFISNETGTDNVILNSASFNVRE